MLVSNLEYVPLRLCRRFLFTDGLLGRLGPFLPHYRVNQGETSPWPIVDAYEALLAKKSRSLRGRAALEVGCGATNATGWAMAASLGTSWTGFEPHAPFQEGRDAALRRAILMDRPEPPGDAVRRVTDLAELPDAAFDLILSNSVLEHVFDLTGLLRQLARLLVPGGAMLHRVDYRDHFFKYPFHFLQFSETTWERLLGPGDLTRRRLPEHLEAMRRQGLRVEVLERQTDEAALAAVEAHLHPDYRDMPREALAVTVAAIYAERTDGGEYDGE